MATSLAIVNEKPLIKAEMNHYLTQSVFKKTSF